MSQAKLAEKLNVCQGMISMIENGDRNPSIDVLIRMAEVLNVTVDKLIQKGA